LKSTRLKRKVLLPLNGYTVIDRVIQRAKKVPAIDDIVLCTSTEHQDLPLIDSARNNNIYYYNGHPDDVLKRLLDAAKLFGMDFFIGITADNPLFCFHHAALISKFIQENPDSDFVFSSGMPIGLNTYAIRTKALEVVCELKEVVDTEIWGPLINRPDIFNVHEIEAADAYRRDVRLTLDEPDDYRLFEEIYASFEPEQVPDVLNVYKLFDTRPELARINSHVVQKELDPAVKARIDAYYRDNRDHVLEVKRRIGG
jgi:spore coat polysaccharide biosynthesis protein SpsF